MLHAVTVPNLTHEEVTTLLQAESQQKVASFSLLARLNTAKERSLDYFCAPILPSSRVRIWMVMTGCFVLAAASLFYLAIENWTYSSPYLVYPANQSWTGSSIIPSLNCSKNGRSCIDGALFCEFWTGKRMDQFLCPIQNVLACCTLCPNCSNGKL